MTAREQAARAKCVYELNGIIIYEYGFASNEFQTFCEALCREQREICANEGREIISSGDTFGLRPNPRVLNAPMPEI